MIAPIELLLVVGVLALMIFLLHWNAKKTRERLHAVAAQFPGMTVEEGGLFRLGRLRHSGAGWRAIASFFGGGKNSSPYSRVEFQLDKPLPSLKLTKQGMMSGIAKFFGAEDVEIGIPDFDREYMIAAHPREFAGRFLDPKARALIGEFRVFAPGGVSLLVEVAGASARVSVAAYWRDADRVVHYLRKAFELGDLLAARTETGAPRRAQDCPVCGQPASADAVRCRACSAVVHRGCWEYLGCCPNFGCGERFSRNL